QLSCSHGDDDLQKSYQPWDSQAWLDFVLSLLMPLWGVAVPGYGSAASVLVGAGFKPAQVRAVPGIGVPP
ncbi:MAG: hypothetical protein WCP58_10120, partial [bacterium]